MVQQVKMYLLNFLMHSIGSGSFHTRPKAIAENQTGKIYCTIMFQPKIIDYLTFTISKCANEPTEENIA